MRNWKIAVAAACVAMAGTPTLAGAQTSEPSAHGMKGPPNANGYGKHEGMDATEPNSNGSDASSDNSAASPSKMKGPPNANGYGK